MITLTINMVTTQDYYSLPVIVRFMKLNLKIYFSKNKEKFDFSNYSTKSKYFDDSNKLVVGKIKYDPAGVAIKEFVELKGKMYSFLVDDSSKHKKVKCCWNNKS